MSNTDRNKLEPQCTVTMRARCTRCGEFVEKVHEETSAHVPMVPPPDLWRISMTHPSDGTRQYTFYACEKCAYAIEPKLAAHVGA